MGHPCPGKCELFLDVDESLSVYLLRRNMKCPTYDPVSLFVWRRGQDL